MPPLNDAELFTPGECGNYILASGRVNASKRQWLLVEAMRYLPPQVNLVIAGPPDTEADAIDLKQRVAAAGLDARVTLDLRFLSRQEIAELVKNSRAVAYIPFDEDSIGYVTMEAFHAAKPVITTSDSGGLLPFVIAGETGCVSDPYPEALAEAISPILKRDTEAIRLGKQAQQKLASLHVNWQSTIERLLS
jgi:glycosyltransferase involved in cell wall biosynthesis